MGRSRPAKIQSSRPTTATNKKIDLAACVSPGHSSVCSRRRPLLRGSGPPASLGSRDIEDPPRRGQFGLGAARRNDEADTKWMRFLFKFRAHAQRRHLRGRRTALGQSARAAPSARSLWGRDTGDTGGGRAFQRRPLRESNRCRPLLSMSLLRLLLLLHQFGKQISLSAPKGPPAARYACSPIASAQGESSRRSPPSVASTGRGAL